MVAEDECVANTRKGKQVLNVSGDVEARVCAIVEGDTVATLGENRKLLIFMLDEVPVAFVIPFGQPAGGAHEFGRVIIERCAAELAPFKVPSRVFWRTQELPRNATGKVLKKDLRDEYSK